MRTAPSLLVRAAAQAEPGQRVLSLSEALRGEAFAGVWDFDADGRIEVVASPSAVSLEQVLRFLPVQLVVGEAPAAMRDELAQRGLPLMGPAWPSAVTLLALCGRPGGARRVDPDRWEPDYGRPAEAQARWERSHGRPLPNPAGDTA
jgi:tRNA A37 threonylcarbamoyladenosine modification protein TsaB